MTKLSRTLYGRFAGQLRERGALGRAGAAMVLAVVLSAGAAVGAEKEAGRQQVLSNPGFEGGAAGWQLPSGEGASIVDDAAHGGSHSLKLSAAKPDGELAVTSEWFAVSADAELDGEVWIRTADLKSGGGGQGRGGRQRGGLSVSLEVFGPDKTSQKMSLGVASVREGSTGEWTRYQAQTLLYKDCAWARYRISLTGAAGTVWIDDAAANYLPVPAPDASGVAMPPVLPRPWIAQRGSDSFELGKTLVVTPSTDSRLREAVKGWLTSLGVEHVLAEGAAADGYAVVLRFESEVPAGVGGHDLTELGDEGYCLSVQKGGDGSALVHAAASSERGRFYAFQTLRQLTLDKKLHAAEVVDRPTMMRRGIVMSAKRFNDPETLERMAEVKMNTSWSQGSFVGDKFKQKWRQPFSVEELATLRAFIGKANSKFITPWMAFGPRGDFDHRAEPDRPRPHPGEVQYSSDKDIDTVVDKMEQLYGVGLRNFGINFDDLQNYREQTLIGADREKWGDDNTAFAKAHAHFLGQIIARLRARHPGEDLNFMTVPYPYWYPSRGRGDAYLRTLAEGLPKDVEMITCSYTDADILAMKELTGRPTMVWHNYFVEDAKTASHHLTNTEYGTPFYGLYTWTDPAIRASMSGLINLMAQPGETPEDAARTSWRTAADWQWAPDRYDPVGSFQAAAALYRSGGGK